MTTPMTSDTGLSLQTAQRRLLPRVVPGPPVIPVKLVSFEPGGDTVFPNPSLWIVFGFVEPQWLGHGESWYHNVRRFYNKNVRHFDTEKLPQIWARI